MECRIFPNTKQRMTGLKDVQCDCCGAEITTHTHEICNGPLIARVVDGSWVIGPLPQGGKGWIHHCSDGLTGIGQSKSPQPDMFEEAGVAIDSMVQQDFLVALI